MWWLYLDESGDLGFDFVNKKPSEFFTICIVATGHGETNRAFTTAVKRTLRHKLNCGKNKSRVVEELKGTTTEHGIKAYAWRHIKDSAFGIYSLTLNKRRVYESLARDKEHVYNFVARKVIDQLPFENAEGGVQLIVDRSKGNKHIFEFNNYIQTQLEGRIPPNVALEFKHVDSKIWPGVQWADMFAWGIFRKYERRKSEWFDIFKDKIRYEEQYL